MSLDDNSPSPIRSLENIHAAKLKNLTPTNEIVERIQKAPTSEDSEYTLKDRILASYRDSYPDLSATLRLVGMRRDKFFEILSKDKDFKTKFDAIEEEKADIVENVNYQLASTGKSSTFMDRIAYLRRVRPEKWNPDVNINIRREVTPGDAAARFAKLKTVIDVEMIKDVVKVAGPTRTPAAALKILNSIDNSNSDMPISRDDSQASALDIKPTSPHTSR